VRGPGGVSERASARALGTTRLNIGINVGRCAGAGVEGHLHIHLVPHPGRSAGGLTPCGDAGSGAVAIEPPEPLVATRERLAEAWRELGVPAEGSHRSNS
jgi:ATP adenylyltransferase